jgi:hypothetical protein
MKTDKQVKLMTMMRIKYYFWENIKTGYLSKKFSTAEAAKLFYKNNPMYTAFKDDYVLRQGIMKIPIYELEMK